jgi:hypothetical protein
VIPHLCKNDGGSRKLGCKACMTRYNVEYHLANWDRLRRPRKVRPQHLTDRVLAALKLGYPLSLYQLWMMLGAVSYTSIRNVCCKLRARGLAMQERIAKPQSQRGGVYQAMRWEAV